jgi:hypothetical protein
LHAIPIFKLKEIERPKIGNPLKKKAKKRALFSVQGSGGTAFSFFSTAI